MKYTDNLGLKKPESTDFYNVDDFNDNMDKIEEELEKRPTDDGDASSMTIEFTEALETATLTSGEKLSVAFGKIARAIRGYMSHILIKGSSSQSGHVKLTDSSAVTDTISTRDASTAAGRISCAGVKADFASCRDRISGRRSRCRRIAL